jgi:hypothetical protein
LHRWLRLRSGPLHAGGALPPRLPPLRCSRGGGPRGRADRRPVRARRPRRLSGARRQAVLARVAPVAPRPRRAAGLDEGPERAPVRRHAGRRHRVRPALPRRRRPALALGRAQCPAGRGLPRAERTALCDAGRAALAVRAGLRAPRCRRRTHRHARRRGLRRRDLPRRVSDRPRRLPRRGRAGRRRPRGVLAAHSARRRRVEPPLHVPPLHAAQPHRAGGRRHDRRLARESRPPRERGAGRGRPPREGDPRAVLPRRAPRRAPRCSRGSGRHSGRRLRDGHLRRLDRDRHGVRHGAARAPRHAGVPGRPARPGRVRRQLARDPQRGGHRGRRSPRRHAHEPSVPPRSPLPALPHRRRQA